MENANIVANNFKVWKVVGGWNKNRCRLFWLALIIVIAREIH